MQQGAIFSITVCMENKKYVKKMFYVEVIICITKKNCIPWSLLCHYLDAKYLLDELSLKFVIFLQKRPDAFSIGYTERCHNLWLFYCIFLFIFPGWGGGGEFVIWNICFKMLLVFHSQENWGNLPLGKKLKSSSIWKILR